MCKTPTCIRCSPPAPFQLILQKASWGSLAHCHCHQINSFNTMRIVGCTPLQAVTPKALKHWASWVNINCKPSQQQLQCMCILRQSLERELKLPRRSKMSCCHTLYNSCEVAVRYSMVLRLVHVKQDIQRLQVHQHLLLQPYVWGSMVVCYVFVGTETEANFDLYLNIFVGCRSKTRQAQNINTAGGYFQSQKTCQAYLSEGPT